MKVELKNLVQVQSGIYEKPGISKEIIYLQARHFNGTGQYLNTAEPELEANDKTQRHLLRNNDILFAIKGHYNFAAVYRKSMGPAVASSIFLVLRDINESVVKPEYLAWILNHPQTILQLKKASKGSFLPSLTKNDLESVIVPIPSIEKQLTIVKLEKLLAREKLIKEKISLLREQQMNDLILKSIHDYEQ